MFDRARRFTLAVIALAAAVGANAAQAAPCGGDKPCACGDKLTADYTLPASLGPCAKDGLVIDAGVTLDGGGNTIRGFGDTGTGVRIAAAASGAQIRNLSVTGFHDGVRLIGAREVRLSAVEAYGNGDRVRREGYGIDVSSAASDNVFEHVRVHENADEGIHVGTDAARNRIVDSQIFANGRENVYFLACHDNRLERSSLRGSGIGNASIYVKFATGTVLEGNTVDGVVEIRGGARDTLLVGNTLLGGVVLKAQDDRRFGSGQPSGTTLRGGRIGGASTCVRIEAATGTRVEDVLLQCDDGVRVAAGNRVAVRLAARPGGKGRVRCIGSGDCVERLQAVEQAAAPTSEPTATPSPKAKPPAKPAKHRKPAAPGEARHK